MIPEILKLLHLVGLVWGMSSSSAESLSLWKISRNNTLAKFGRDVLDTNTKLIWGSIAVLYITGLLMSRFTNNGISQLSLFMIIATSFVVVLRLIMQFRFLPAFYKSAKNKKEVATNTRNVLYMSILNTSIWYVLLIVEVWY